VLVELRGLTDIGRVRQNNEDTVVVDETAMMGIVCDGAGGHNAGEVASALASETLSRLLKRGSGKTLSTALPANPELTPAARNLVAAVRLANQRILAMASASAERRDMATTVAAMQFTADGTVNVANVGDSRVYRLRDGVLHQLTRDHTYLSDLLEDKEISPEEARTFRQKNLLTRALGTSPTVKVDVRSDAALAGDVYLVCSDGLYGPVDDESIAGILHSNREDPAIAAQMLVDEANRNGGPDNVTVVAAAVRDAPPATGVQPVKLEVPDNEAELPRREKALRRAFPMPRNPESKRVVMLVGAGIALVLIAVALLLVIRPKPAAKREFRPSYVTVVIQPAELSGAAEVALSGRPIALAGTKLDSGCSSETLTVELAGYRKFSQVVSAQGCTTSIVARLQPEATVGIRYDNHPAEDQVTLRWKKVNGAWRETTFATRDLVTVELTSFPLEGAGTYTFRLSAGGRDLVSPTTRSVGVGKVVGFVPDNPAGIMKIEDQKQ